jgi:hypothetical protein
MAALILNHSNPPLLVCVIGAAATFATVALVAGVAAVVEAVRAWLPRRVI